MTRAAPARTAARPRTAAAVAGALVAACLLPATALPPGTAAAATGHAPTGAGPRAAVAGDDLLDVTLEGLSPAVVPEGGWITVSGRVVNRTATTWEDVQAYVFGSQSPISSRADLAVAATTDATDEIGSRVTAEGRFAELGDLDPGDSVRYTVRVSRSDLELSGEPGVYWLGVHVLGGIDGARDLVADGRARTFVPLVPEAAKDEVQPATRLALALPVRDLVRRDEGTRLLGEDRWQRSLAPGGRLDRLLDFGRSGGDPFTWVVDPAVLEAVASVAAGNPALTTADDGTGPAEGTDDGGASPSASPLAVPSAPRTGEGGGASSSADPGDQGEDGAGEPAPEPTEAQVTAARWLAAFATESRLGTVLALPYADLDVAAAGTHRMRDLLSRALEAGQQSTEALGVDAEPVVAPVSGYLPGAVLDGLGDDVPVLLSDVALPAASGTQVTRRNGVEVLLSDSRTGSGGPGPDDRQDPLALRQRILAEAALHAVSEDAAAPMVVRLPEDWDPGPAWRRSDFFDGLDVPWIEQVDLPSILVRSDAPVDVSVPVYPVAEREAQLPEVNLLASEQLAGAGATYAELLTSNDSVSAVLSRASLLSSATAARPRPVRALRLTQATTLAIRDAMAAVAVEAPAFVMMSSDTGPIQVTVANDLDVPVTVRLVAVEGSDGLVVGSPAPLVLGPGQRTPVRVRADATRVGVHPVTLQVTTESGAPTGSTVSLSVRTSNVGLVIWIVMGAGALLFLLALAARIRRRRRAPSPPGPVAA